MNESIQFATGATDASRPKLRVASAISALLLLHNVKIDSENLIAGISLAPNGDVPLNRLDEVGHRFGFTVGFLAPSLAKVSPLVMPVLALMKDGSALIVHARDDNDIGLATVELPESVVLRAVSEFPDSDIEQIIVVKPRREALSRSFVPFVTEDLRWFRDIFFRYKRYYIDAAVATVIANLLALASAFFSMNIYDRVVPNQAFVTLWTLTIGTSIAIISEFVIRWLKAQLIDASGKKADLLINAALFRELLSTRLEHRPPSVGSFTSSMKDFESLRDFFSSATLVAVTDLPFSLVFLIVIYFLAGPIVIVPLAAIPIVILISIFSQPVLSASLRANMQESADRQAVLVESLLNFEAVKALKAENYLQTKYEISNAFAAQSYHKVKFLTSFVNGLSGTIQQLINVAMIVWGVYLIGGNQITMGGLIAASMLSGRAISPLAQLMGLATRYQQTKLAMETLKGIAKRPKERPVGPSYISLQKVEGAIEVSELGFAYPGPEAIPVVKDVALKLKPGERLGILGRIGSGKSTLLRLLAGLYTQTNGSITIDGVNLSHLDLALLRNHIGYLGQDAQLFHGTLRENLVLSDKHITDDRIVDTLKALGLLAFVEAHPKGLGMVLSEGGVGLSGGQKQAIAIARMMLRSPRIVLLDEPTSAMDQNTESQIIGAVNQWLRGRTLILVTHRLQLLGMVNRVAVMEKGQIVLDGPRDEVLAKLSGDPSQSAAKQGQPVGRI